MKVVDGFCLYLPYRYFQRRNEESSPQTQLSKIIIKTLHHLTSTKFETDKCLFKVFARRHNFQTFFVQLFARSSISSERPTYIKIYQGI